MSVERDGRDGTPVDGPPGAKRADGMPPAGPHADPALTDEDATPGTGALPEAGGAGEGEVDPAGG